MLQVVIQKIPENLQEFEILAAKGRQPEHICALFLCALALFDRDKDAGVAAMNLLRGPKPMTPYDCQFLRDRLHILKAQRRKMGISRACHTR